jgi:hypothetical protein
VKTYVHERYGESGKKNVGMTQFPSFIDFFPNGRGVVNTFE